MPAGQRTAFVAMPLQYRRPASVIPKAKELFGGKSVNFAPLVEANAVLISGPGGAVRGAMQAIDALDQSVLRDKYSMRINPLYLPAELLARELNEVLTAQGVAVKSGPGEAGALNFVPVNSANALIVFANSQQALDMVAGWVERLDQPSDSAGGGGMYVYAVRHTTVDTMLPVLQALAGSTAMPAADGTVPAATDATGSAAANTAAGARARPGRATAVSGFGGHLAADSVRNMIVFRAMPRAGVPCRACWRAWTSR
ncbi:hypothetical protein H1235_03465 [Pseudoxanthomonas sp. NC8]|nr:hypothetical protein H1235_03465 [Pseudoxanthomonas sp. NC8]